MRRIQTVILTSLLTLGTAAALAPRAVAQYAYERDDHRDRSPMRGRRYEMLQTLAQSLDERASHARDVAIVRVRYGGGWRERRFVQAINQFAYQAEMLHRRMDAYSESPFDVSAEVASLEARARTVERAIQSVGVYERVYDDWRATRDLLARMRGVLEEPRRDRQDRPPLYERDAPPYER